MDWKYFFIGVGFLAFAYWCYRNVKGKSFLDEDGTPTYDFGKDWLWAIGGAIFGMIIILKSVPFEVAMIIVLCLILFLVIFIFRWLFKIFRRLFKGQDK
jgi:hypothetical protein